MHRINSRQYNEEPVSAATTALRHLTVILIIVSIKTVKWCNSKANLQR